jgi:hypothetical protein
MDSTQDVLEGVEEELIARSFLFTDPVSYRDGVGAATKAFRAMLATPVIVRQRVRNPGEETS